MIKIGQVGIFIFVFCLPCFGIATPSAAERDRLTSSEFFTANNYVEGPVDTRFFMPIGPVTTAKHNLSATLVIPEIEGRSFGALSGASVEM